MPTQFSPFGSKGGTWWGRRASDSKIVRLKDSAALAWVKKPAMTQNPPKSANEFLLIWWVPPEYKKEAKWRIEKGWIKPAWSWDKGNLKLKGDVVKKQSSAKPLKLPKSAVAAGRMRVAAGKTFADFMMDAHLAFWKEAVKSFKKLTGSKVRWQAIHKRTAVWLDGEGVNRSDMEITVLMTLIVKEPSVTIYMKVTDPQRGTMEKKVPVTIGALTPETTLKLFQVYWGVG